MGANNQIPASSVRDRVLVIMAKAPKPGAVKTRLAASLPSSSVTAFYRCLLSDTIALAKSLTGVTAVVMCPAADQQELAEFLGNELPVFAQTGQGLAAGLASVFQRFTQAGEHVIAFNSDSPHLAPSVLYGAFAKLASHDVVIGPTQDGGYYLVGAKKPCPSLFENDGLGTSTALQRLVARTTSMELSTAFTETFYDIDVVEDLLLLGEELQSDPAKAPRTAAWFRDSEHLLAPLRDRPGVS